MAEYERSAQELALVRSRIPYLYDFYYEIDQVWPFYTMAWGPMLPGYSSLPDVSIARSFDAQTLYYAQSTSSIYKPDWNQLNGPPHLLVQAEIALPNEYNVADMQRAAGNQSPASLLTQSNNHDEYALWIKDTKKLVHPGEVNRIAVVQSNDNLVVTHTDHPRVLLWDFNSQKTRKAQSGATASIPDLVLIGHDYSEYIHYEKIMYFALDVCKTEPLVASGGPDQNVLVWSIADYQSAASVVNQPKKSVNCREKFAGHTACVEDVAWHPTSSSMLASVGDDRSLRLWDLRTGHGGLLVATGHQDDVNALSWNPCYDQYILTASSDKSVHLIDIRYVRESVAVTGHLISVFDAHERDVKCVSWAPDGLSFASGGDDARVNVWSLNNIKHGDTLPSGGQKTTENFFVDREYAKPSADARPPVTPTNAQSANPPNNQPTTPSSASATTQPAPAQRVNPQVAYANILRKLTPGPSSLKFSHKVHPSAILSLNWNPFHPPGQTICSISGIDGGVMQIWRINELLQMPVLQSTEKVRLGKRLRNAEAGLIRNQPASVRTAPPGAVRSYPQAAPSVT